MSRICLVFKYETNTRQIRGKYEMNPALRLVTPAQERINDPANPNHYWRYRMPVMIEDLIDDNNFNELIKTLTANGGRE